MSNVLLPSQADAYHRAADVPQEVRRALSRDEAAGNVILSSLLHGGDDESLWIAVFDGIKNVEFVLSCTKGPLGDYPIFIVACKSNAQFADEERRGRHLSDSLSPLVQCLLENAPPRRVFSVFATSKVANTFAEIFQAHTHEHGIQMLQDPYYSAILGTCTRETFVESLDLTLPLQETEEITLALRRADMSHLEGVAALCKAFSETSPPYVLDDARARLEAETMITNRQVWVHTMQREGQEPEVACLVATTRESDNVTAVTKVITAKEWRRRGCALRLLCRVAQEIFRVQNKQQIVLFVGTSAKLASARGIYAKIGFQGLSEEVKEEDGWLELGFEGTTLGYW